MFKYIKKVDLLGMYGIVVAVVIQSIFRLEMLQNDVFFKKLFLRSAHQNDMKTYKNNNFQQKEKKFKF